MEVGKHRPVFKTYWVILGMILPFILVYIILVHWLATTPIGEPLPRVSWNLKKHELRVKGRNELRGRNVCQILTMINSCLEIHVPSVEGCVEPELASTVTYGHTDETVFMEDNLTRLRVIAREKESTSWIVVRINCEFELLLEEGSITNIKQCLRQKASDSAMKEFCNG